jgi:hypothetical protein
MPLSPELAILGACAMPQGHPRQRARLDELLAGPVRWDDLVALAARQNMGPLVWHHVREAAGVPGDARLGLTTLRLQQRRLVPFQNEVMARILDVAAAAGVRVMFLKGAALRRVAYPDPELRAMRDIDLIAPATDGGRLHDALAEAGFARVDPATHPIHHPVLAWREGTFGVGVEIHWVIHRKWNAGFEELAPRAAQIDVMGRPAWIPSPLDLLRHVYLHCFGSDLWLGSRLVAIADLIALLETGEGAFDPARLDPRDRTMLRALGWLDLLAPLSDRVRSRVGPAGASRGVGEFYEGWPLPSGARPWRSWRHFRATFLPSPWWLRIRFRARPGRLPLAWAWARHVFNVSEVWW